MDASYHHPVLLKATLDALVLDPRGAYLDATAGGGGHSAGILERLAPEGRLVALDRDGEAIARLEGRFGGDGRVAIVRSDFAGIGKRAEIIEAAPYAGILFDFGVSSRQIDDPGRGFSFAARGPLDMRMDDRLEVTAADIVNGFEEADLVRLLREYGEEPKAKRIARAIVESRPMHDTPELAEVVRRVVRGPQEVKALARVFQAIRIEVNGELTAIDEALPAVVALLAPGGRLVTLAYHSLEDRRVKEFLRRMAGEHEVDPYLPPVEQEEAPELRLIGRKAVKATEEEIAENPRARSVRMRIAEKVAT